ncbi:hypothetical protein [Janthinobacterium sp. UMAB-56]|uniref:hypothetical protein n=1 Tax=Janthinobacterium sp. UMAB-56 TaxID=1365361 RepID=UPI001C592E76|nr:hypothetical protein [Janthinobacterium sp. UMAB-56]
MNAAEFAGQYLALNSDGFLMMALVNPGESASGIQFTGTLAIPMRDAFLVQLENGWRLIGGVNESGCRLNRTTLSDVAPGADERAAKLEKMGIPVLSVEAGRENLKQHGIPMHHVNY